MLAENRFRLLSAHMPGIIFEFDAQARYIGVWTAHPELLARPAEELLGHSVLEALGEEVGRPFDERIRRMCATGIPEEYEYVLDVTGGRRAFMWSAVVLPTADGRERTVILQVRDETDHVHTKRKLLQAERLASVGFFAAGVAHEINNPLAYMLLNLGRLQQGLHALGLPPEKLTDLEQAVALTRDGAERVRKIVEDLRVFSKAEDDAPRPVDLLQALSFSIDMSLAQEKNARLVRDFGVVPLVEATESRLTQVFINLFTNAAQAIAPGHPDENEIRLVTRTDERGWAVIEVFDTGCGISPKIMDRIFDPFFTTKDAKLGSGLGLSICHSIVKSLDGEIEVESKEGEGSVFRVSFPPAMPPSRRRW
jgi:two-component system NtrC family sensor kinase